MYLTNSIKQQLIPFLIGFSLAFLVFLAATVPSYAAASGISIKAPSATFVATQEVNKEDTRVIVLEAFLASYDSPLTPSAKTFVATADKYKLDWRFVAAISGVESTFGHQIPYESYNAWGWGIYGDNTHSFASFDEGIETISQGLRERYIDKWGAEDTYAIGRIYAASPTWAQRVEYFMGKMKEFELKNP